MMASVGVGVCAVDHYDNHTDTVKPTPIPSFLDQIKPTHMNRSIYQLSYNLQY
jgi:hypothetical protein